VGKLSFQPELHGPDQRQRSGLAHALPYDGGLAADSGLDRIELGNPPQRLGRDGRAGRLVDLVEPAPRMRPAGREPDVGAELLEPGIAVDLDHTFELGQMGGRPLGLPVGAVEIDGSRRISASVICTVTNVGAVITASSCFHRRRTRRSMP